MKFRGGLWKCYRHEKRRSGRVRLDPETYQRPLQLERAPDFDVIGRIAKGEILEGFYNEDGKYEIVAIKDGASRKLSEEL